ncbi:hypothetical protein AN644_00810 [Candidatus Epulonipiscium fishelsonii]|nr:hypothetical protein AN644_00810 [Epulopiscium sp. SCG-C06WGA-EpuloA1]
MRLVPVENLKMDSKLSIDIFMGDGSVIYENGTLVNLQMIETLQKINVKQVYISDEYSFTDDTFFPTTDQKVIGGFVSSFQNITLKIKEHHFEENDFNELYKLAEKAIRLHLIFRSKLKIRYFPENMFGNAYFGKNVHIPMVCAILGSYCGYGLEKLTKLFIAAFLRDISLDFPIFEKEINKIHLHPVATCQFLSSKNFNDIEIMEAIKQHHELINGEGSPNNLKEQEICEFAKIIAIVDRFFEFKESLTDVSNFRNDLSKFYADAFKMFDKKILDLLFANSYFFPLDTLFQLSTNDIVVTTTSVENNFWIPHFKVVKPSSQKYKFGETIILEETPDIDLKKIVYYVD